MSSSNFTYDQPAPKPSHSVKEEQIEYGFVGKLQGLKYEYREDIRDRAALERNFREKFEALNRVHLTDGEFARLLDEIVTVLKEYLVKGFVMDDERLKNPDGRPDYFDEMLARIRDIRASEKRFYQKVRDLFGLSSDYDKSDEATQTFFATVQNLLIYAVAQKTAAELILSRANPADAHFGLLSWKGDLVRKQDIVVAQNYLTKDEVDTLNRLVVIFLETAELRAKRQTSTSMNFWRENVGQIIVSNSFDLLSGAGSVNHARMEQKLSRCI